MEYWFNLTFACAYIATDSNNTVIKTAPIFKWCIGKDLSSVIGFYDRRNQYIELKKLDEF